MSDLVGPRVAFVFLDYWPGVSVSALEMARGFARRGLRVDLFGDSRSIADAPAIAPEDGLRIVDLGQTWASTRGTDVCGGFKTLLPPRVRQTLRPMRRLVDYGLFLLRSVGRSPYSTDEFLHGFGVPWKEYMQGLTEALDSVDYGLVVAVEPQAVVVVANVLGGRTGLKTPVVYYNLELLRHSLRLNYRGHMLKRCEAACVADCSLVLLPDRQRGQAWSTTTRVDQGKLRYLPVSASGPAVTSPGRFFREKFAVPEGRRIALYAGNIRPWAMCREIVESVRDWPEEWVLVMHSWRKDVEDEPYFQEVRLAAPTGRVFFSTAPLGQEEFVHAIASADAGIALYRPIDENFTEIGSSSNKLAMYARAGLPLVVSDFPSTRDIVEEYHSGVCVTDADAIAGALSVIASEQAAFRQGALSSYRHHYDFEAVSADIMEEMMDLTKVRRCG